MEDVIRLVSTYLAPSGVTAKRATSMSAPLNAKVSNILAFSSAPTGFLNKATVTDLEYRFSELISQLTGLSIHQRNKNVELFIST